LSNVITLSKTAASEVSKVMQEQDLEASDHFLRVGVKGGGCSGFKFSMDVVSFKEEDDEEWEYDGVKVICDPKSYVYLKGTEIDFKDELMGRGFVFSNVDHQQCGCGSSFTPT